MCDGGGLVRERGNRWCAYIVLAAITVLGGCQDSPTAVLTPGGPRFTEPIRLPGVEGGGGDCSQSGWTRDENGVCQPPPAPTGDPSDPGNTDGENPGGGGGDSPPPDPQETPTDTTCKTSDPLLNSQPVQAAFEDLWKDSNYEVNGIVQPQSERRERGGFIIQTGNGYTVQPFPADWIYGPCSIAFPLDYRPPAGTVAYVHTHPFTYGEKQTSCDPVVPGTSLYQNYPGRSSDGDNKTAGHWGISGYLLDADHIARFTADEASADVPFGRCAY